MSIGKIGKKAQRMGQTRQQRYRVTYLAPRTDPLPPPQRTSETIQRTPDTTSTPTVIIDPPPIQRAPPTDEGQQSPSTTDQAAFLKAVTDRVYKMLVHDMRLEQERRGTRFKR